MENETGRRRFVLPVAIAAAVVVVAVFGVIVLTRGPADAGQLLDKGMAYLNNERYDKALEQFRTVIDADPKATETAYIGAANAYIGLDRPDRAARILEKGYKNTNSGTIQRRLGELAASPEYLGTAGNAGGYGNTNGNLSNDALAAVQGEWIFYIVGDTLYKAKADGTEETRLTDGAYCVNVSGDWVYFVKDDNIYKIKTDGTEETPVAYDFVRSSPIAVSGNWIYYATVQSYNSPDERMMAEDISMITGEYGIYRIRTDGSEQTQLSPLVCHGLNVADDWLYFLDSNDSLYKIRTDGGEATLLSEEACRFINVVEDRIYYILAGDNGIYEMRTDGSENTRISGDYTSYLNVSGDFMYYSDFTFEDYAIGEDTGLYKMRTDGSEKTQLTNDRAIVPNIAGEWIYYLSFDDEYGLNFNKIRTDGTDGRRIN